MPEPTALLLVPFLALLLLIATMPLSPAPVKALWERYYPWVAGGLAAIVIGYYFRSQAGRQIAAHTAAEYISFIALIGSLYVIAGGIHIAVKGEATPLANVAFLAIGCVVANLIGTTGASMVLIRPWIRMNKVRISAFHVVFFIFLVSNIGGALTPVGDPPLFLGYLQGIPFFWLCSHAIPQWLLTVGAILAAFYWFDHRSFKHMPKRLQGEIVSHPETWRFDGAVNVLLLMAVIGAVFIPDRYFLRELAMVAAAITSWWLTPQQVRAENRFSFGPFREVAILFIGIFATMMPVLDYIAQQGRAFGVTQPLHYYLASGLLSSVLDNAPTYMNFLQLAKTTAHALAPNVYGTGSADPATGLHLLLDRSPKSVVGVSLGAVFFGAMTYIGNGPNFIVKSIAHDAGVHCPSFFGYIARYSVPVLLPILVLIGIVFL